MSTQDIRLLCIVVHSDELCCILVYSGLFYHIVFYLELQINRVIIAINAINFFSQLTRLIFLIAM